MDVSNAGPFVKKQASSMLFMDVRKVSICKANVGKTRNAACDPRDREKSYNVGLYACEVRGLLGRFKIYAMLLSGEEGGQAWVVVGLQWYWCSTTSVIFPCIESFFRKVHMTDGGLLAKVSMRELGAINKHV